MSAILNFDFQKSKLSKLHKKYAILHVTTTFSLKQEETRTSSVPIPHPLKSQENMLQVDFIEWIINSFGNRF